MKKRVVVTGVGVISALGLKVADFWENLLRGKSGISEIESFSLAKFPFQRKYGGEIKNFQVADFVSNPAVSKYGRSTQMAIAAAKECLADAAYAVADDPFRIGVVLGTTMGEPLELAALDDVWHENFSQTVSGQTCDNYFFSKISQRTAKEFGICGPNLMLANACAAGNFSVAQACEYIREGRVDAMLAGGSDSFNRATFAGFCRLGAVSPDVPRPFSANREGMIPAEGAGVLLLEDYASAKGRNAKIYAEVIGYGFSNDAHHITQGHPEGMAAACRKALQMAEVFPEDISYISVHGTGTHSHDLNEVRALRLLWGDGLSAVPLSSIKASLGHAMGAASALEAVVSVLCLRDQVLPPTINFTTLDPECAGIDVVPNFSRKCQVNLVLETASGFGGNNCALVFKKAA